MFTTVNRNAFFHRSIFRTMILLTTRVLVCYLSDTATNCTYFPLGSPRWRPIDRREIRQIIFSAKKFRSLHQRRYVCVTLFGFFVRRLTIMFLSCIYRAKFTKDVPNCIVDENGRDRRYLTYSSKQIERHVSRCDLIGRNTYLPGKNKKTLYCAWYEVHSRSNILHESLYPCFILFLRDQSSDAKRSELTRRKNSKRENMIDKNPTQQ